MSKKFYESLLRQFPFPARLGEMCGIDLWLEPQHPEPLGEGRYRVIVSDKDDNKYSLGLYPGIIAQMAQAGERGFQISTFVAKSGKTGFKAVALPAERKEDEK